MAEGVARNRRRFKMGILWRQRWVGWGGMSITTESRAEREERERESERESERASGEEVVKRGGREGERGGGTERARKEAR